MNRVRTCAPIVGAMLAVGTCSSDGDDADVTSSFDVSVSTDAEDVTTTTADSTVTTAIAEATAITEATIQPPVEEECSVQAVLA